MTRFRRLVLVIIASHLAIGSLYDWTTPPFEASDEGSHYSVVNRLAQGNGLPIQRIGETRDWEQEGSQPPLYYWLAAGLVRLVNPTDYAQVYVRNPLSRVGVPGTTHNANLFRHPITASPPSGTVLAVHLVRWFSLLLSAVTIWLTAALAQQAFPGSESIQLFAAALVAFNPMALFINASVNNDNLLMLLSTAALAITLHFMQMGVRGYLWKAAGFGLVLGLAALTKVSGLVLWPVAALGVGWGAWHARDGRRFVFGGAVILLAALAISGWWFVRNQQLYGELLGLNTMVAIAGPRPPGLTLLALVAQEAQGFWLSYWGVFGVFSILAADWVYWLFNLLTFGALAGLAVALWRRRKPSAEMLVLASFCLLTLIGLIRWTMQTYASQGRLMFGAIAPLSLFMAAGLAVLAGSLAQPRWAVWPLRVGVFVLVLTAAVIPVAYIAPRYAPPPQLSEDDLPPDLHPVRVQFGDGMELLGYTTDASPQLPGQSQKVTLYWRALAAMDRDYALALHLLGRGAQEIGKIDSWPGGGNAPTSFWQSGTLFADTYLLPIAVDATVPTLTRLAVDVWDGAPENHLPARDSNGTALSSVLLPVGRAVPAQSPRFTPALVEGSTFEHGIALLGLDAEAGGVIYLYWRTDGQVPGDYTLFLHVLDSSGVQIAQADAPPLDGDWPTSAWVPGLAFADRHEITLPPGLAPGRYSLRLGFYDPASGARLTAFRADGVEWPDDAVIITNAVTVQ